MIAASWAADRVDKLMVWSCDAYVTTKDLELYETTRDVHGGCRSEASRLSQFEMGGQVVRVGSGLGPDGQTRSGIFSSHGPRLEIFPDVSYFLQIMCTEKFVSIVNNFLTAKQ